MSELETLFQTKVLDFAEQFKEAVEQVKQAQQHLAKLQTQRANLAQDLTRYERQVSELDRRNIENVDNSTDEQRKAYVIERKQASEMVRTIKEMLPELDGKTIEAQNRLLQAQTRLEREVEAKADGPGSEVAGMILQKIIEAAEIFSTWQQVSGRVCSEKSLPSVKRLTEPKFAFSIAARTLPEMPESAKFLKDSIQDVCERSVEGVGTAQSYLEHNTQGIKK
jgi:DNA repair ATPase RecN